MSLFDDAELTQIHADPGDPYDAAFVVQWHLMGQKFTGLNGGLHHTLTPAASIKILVDTQAQIDRLWAALSEGGTLMQCGWLTDRFGVSWQIVPRALRRLMMTEDSVQARRVREAMTGMVKFDIAGLETAAKA